MSTIVKQIITDTAVEMLEVNDIVKVVDSPLDGLRKGSKGLVTEVKTYEDTTFMMVTVLFRLNKKLMPLVADSRRFKFEKKKKEKEKVEDVLPDAAAESVHEDEDAE